MELIKDLGIKEKNGYKLRWGLYKCGHCGNLKETRVDHVKGGRTKSCGCLRHKRGEESSGYKHGLRYTPFYKTWRNMRERCKPDGELSNNTNYGKRGIRVCQRWDDFMNFKEDMYDSYLEARKTINKVQIDRIDNGGNYCKANCRWVDSKTNCNNKTTNIYINNPETGEIKTLKQWTECHGLNYYTIRSRWYLGGIRNFNKLFTKEKLKAGAFNNGI